MNRCAENVDFSGKSCSVCGVGVSNYPIIDYLLKSGAIVVARDIKPKSKLPHAEELERRGVKLICGEDYLDDIKEEYIFRAPGIRYDVPQFQRAVADGSVMTSEMELFFKLCPCRIIGVTGSDGKTTTTTLIYKMLTESGLRAFIGGNIGASLLPAVGEMTENDIAVVELSSFQLHTMNQSPDIAVVTNISPNHLNYHHSMEEYIDAKRNIYRYMNGGRLVLNERNEISRGMKYDAPDGTEVIYFAGDSGVYMRDGKIIVSASSGGNGGRSDDAVLDAGDILLPGRHNKENYMAAIAAVYGIASNDSIRSVAKNFGGVEHRCELVGECRGSSFYNSSIDSSPSRTIAALGNFEPGKAVVICGGYDKHISFDALAAPLCERAKAVILTGAAAPLIASALDGEISTRKAEGKTVPPIIYESDFDKAIECAYGCASSGDIVLLSPACASFDAFQNFEERGNRFKSVSNAIIQRENGIK